MGMINNLQTEAQRQLAGRVLFYKARRGLSLQKLAAELAWNYTTLHRVLKEKTGMRPHQEERLQEFLARQDLTVRQEELARLITQLGPEEVDAASQILHIMQNMRVGRERN
ncbi:hypothetical protein [Bradyrhizobium sp. Ec3.3]|uniref:hypothetical protein n=1 Tax=Bradyrhizobium sp. Ec3.3 TaxID=189753 RepID=UPI0004895326|nr:hypothetical protein [Bradyrhizobium sp. Ec3.3]